MARGADVAMSWIQLGGGGRGEGGREGGVRGGQPAATWFQREPDPTAPTFSDGTWHLFYLSLVSATFRNQIVLQSKKKATELD